MNQFFHSVLEFFERISFLRKKFVLQANRGLPAKKSETQILLHSEGLKLELKPVYLLSILTLEVLPHLPMCLP